MAASPQTWTAPDVDRTDPPYLADERVALDSWVNFHRATLLRKCAGLDAAQLRARPLPAAGLSLLGLVRHMTEVERWWFRMNVAGEDLDWPYTEDADDADWNWPADAVPEADLAALRAEMAACREAAAGLPLDHRFESRRRRVPMDLRWIYIHMIEDYARHNAMRTCCASTSTAPPASRSPSADAGAGQERGHRAD